MSEREIRKRLFNPKPGSAFDRARAYGVDLSLIARNVMLSPDQLLDNASRGLEMSRAIARIRATNGKA